MLIHDDEDNCAWHACESRTGWQTNQHGSTALHPEARHQQGRPELEALLLPRDAPPRGRGQERGETQHYRVLPRYRTAPPGNLRHGVRDPGPGRLICRPETKEKNV